MSLPLLVEAPVLVVALGLAAYATYLQAKVLAPIARAARRSAAPEGSWRPKATIIVPCRGEQQGFEDNLLAIARQDYPDYEVLAVADDAGDPAWKHLQAVQAKEPRVKPILSEPDLVGRDWPTGKMIAQWTGVKRARPESEVIAFADADGRPGPQWLASLAGPLEDPKVGVVSSYRWYHALTKPSWATILRDSWDHHGIEALYQPQVRLIWGGSMAVRRAEFEGSLVPVLWKKSIADDIGIAIAYAKMGKELRFAPGAIAACPEDGRGREVAKFMLRQMAILASAVKPAYDVLVKRYTAYAALALGGLGLLLAGLTLGDAPVVAGGLAMLVPTFLAWPRAWYREQLPLKALPHLRARRGERLLALLASPLFQFQMLWIFVKVRGMRSVTWRGRTYELAAPPPQPAQKGS